MARREAVDSPGEADPQTLVPLGVAGDLEEGRPTQDHQEVVGVLEVTHPTAVWTTGWATGWTTGRRRWWG